MEAKSQRLFLALALPAAVREVLAALAQPLPGVNWTRLDQLHLTLRFLGEVPPEKIAAVQSGLADVKIAPFLLPVEGCGTFPPNGPPRVLWAGIGAGHPRLFQLRQRIDDALLRSGLDFEVRTFHPHITLARCREGAGRAINAWLHAQREWVAPPFRVEAFDLCASELGPAGAVHTLLQRSPLAD